MTTPKGEAGMEDLIPVVNKIQDIIFSSSACDTLNLPQVVVVGAQSSGKSSVIELLVRRDFLPRGTGIVTRRPLAISLINDKQEHCEFLHLKGEKFTDFNEVRNEIEKETQRLAGSNKGISSQPISLKVYSPHVVDLTIVDLPGVTKVPIGDQPADIEKQTKDLVLQYITNPNSIILAVTPANQDLVNSESLKMARSVDPSGKRTLGVLTKLDLMDKGTNALDIINGVTYPLKLGFIGIVNRSQQDIQDRKSLDESIKAEHEFFKTHPAYRSIAHKCGTTYLSKSLNQILLAHIKDRLPDFKAQLNTQVTQIEQELKELGDSALPDNVADQGGFILDLVKSYSDAFTDSIDGSSNNVDVEELGGGARIYNIFASVFQKNLEKIDVYDKVTYSKVLTAIRNSAGPRACLFVPERAFETLIKPLIKELEPPAKQCVDMVYEELNKISHSCAGQHLQRFPKLQNELIMNLTNLLKANVEPTMKYVESLITIEQAYIKTDHPRFISDSNIMNDVFKKKQDRDFKNLVKQTSDEDEIEEEEVEEEVEEEQVKVSETGDKKKDMFLNYFLGVNQKKPLTTSIGTPRVKVAETAEEKNRIDARTERLETEAASLTQEERTQCDLMFGLITSYFEITRETISDLVPKAIMHLLVNNSKMNAHNRLVAKLYNAERFNSLLFEDENVVGQRNELKDKLKRFQDAQRVLSDVI